MHTDRGNQPDLLNTFNALVNSEQYDQADAFIQSVLQNQQLIQMPRSDALAFIYRIGYVYPETVLSFITRYRRDIPKPYIDCLRMATQHKPSNRIYRGADKLVSIKSALYQKKYLKARWLLYRFYRSFGLLPIPLITNKRLSIGINYPLTQCLSNSEGVTSIMTSYNSSKFIRQSLWGLMNQTIEQHEIIVVDDASTDDTKDIIEQEFPNVKLIKLTTNQGTYHARNVGARAAKHRFITFQDSDDWSHPQRLELQLENLIVNPDVVANFSKFFRVNVATGLPDARQLYPLMRLNLSSLMIRKTDFLQLGGFDATQRIESDKKFFELLKSEQQKYHIIHKPLAVGSYRKNSLTTDSELGFNRYGFSKHRVF